MIAGTLACLGIRYFFLPHRAAAALRAISWRRLEETFSIRAALPISEISMRRSGDSFLALSFARDTAAEFFFAICSSSNYTSLRKRG